MLCYQTIIMIISVCFFADRNEQVVEVEEVQSTNYVTSAIEEGRVGNSSRRRGEHDHPKACSFWGEPCRRMILCVTLRQT